MHTPELWSSVSVTQQYCLYENEDNIALNTEQSSRNGVLSQHF